MIGRGEIGPRRAGFTIMELIGVMAILSILASMLVPSIMARITRANSSKESKTLVAIGGALESIILHERLIPDGTKWAGLVADELSVPLDEVTESVGQQPRVYLVDPEITIGGQVAALPYEQLAAGSGVAPQNVRVMLVSSRLLPLPAFLRSSGIAENSADFKNLWNAPRGTVPSGWPSDWAARGEDLHVERLNLDRLFHHVVINDITDGSLAQLSIDGAAAITVPPGGADGYYLNGTELSLLKNGVIASREVIDQDLSYTYERGIWRGQLWEGKAKDATAMAAALDKFRLSRITQQAASISSQQLVIDAFHNYALLHASWARAGFPTYDASNQIVPLYQALLEAQGQLELLSGNLILKE
ncbi:MAG: prepilin-type N-terminal cleavage/methylation domain-containing protein [Pseudoalteromonas tetraodonis]|jgi:prepilin-type N-terminal cleavage/methylation domain-containing protein